MKSRYGKVTPQVIEELIEILGEAGVSTRKEELEGYSCDEMPLPNPHAPQVVVKPGDTLAVAKVMALASERGIPVTPRGAGTGLSGGAVPLFGGIVLSLERMNRILEIDEANFVAVVEAGVALGDLGRAVEERGLCYPPYPGEMSATMGGNIATNAGGMRAVKHGVTRHFVLGLEAVLPTGEIVQTGGKFVKCTSGYDLSQLIIGSEGTLAVVTRIILKLSRPPSSSEVLFVPFESLTQAINTVPEILSRPSVPVGIEFMERDVIEIAEAYLERELPFHQYAAFLLITVEGESEEELHRACQAIEEICTLNGAVETFVPGSARARRRLLETRERFYHAIKSFGPMEIADAVVPRSQIAEFVSGVKGVAAKHGVPVVVYGHAGDGNVHLHPILKDVREGERAEKAFNLMVDIYQVGASFGGAISGEHGIGFDKKEYLAMTTDEALLGLMRRIKMAFDPQNILNPGKIFDLK